jgi:hypothetical protein
MEFIQQPTHTIWNGSPKIFREGNINSKNGRRCGKYRRNLNMNSIEVISEVNAKVIDLRLIHLSKLISLTEDSLQHVEHKLKT